jgi:predicted phage tail protein
MKTVYLHGKLGKRFGRKWRIAAKTPIEIIQALEANSEGFIDYIQKKAIDGEHYIFLKKDPKYISSEKDVEDSSVNELETEIKYKNEEIHIVSGAYGGVVASFVGGLITGGSLFGISAATIGAVASAMVWGAVAQIGMNVLFKPPKPPKRGTPTTTKSFLMSGSQTRQAQGIAVPLGYGRLRIGGATISHDSSAKRIRNSSNDLTLESFSNMGFVDLLCEGPIEGFVNKYGGPISGGDIREGIYLNDVQVKNTPSSNGQEGTFNYILNESEDSEEGKCQFKAGSAFDDKIISSSVSSYLEYNTLLYGPGPYENNNKDKPKANYVSHSEAISQSAKVFSHFVANKEVDQVRISFKTELQINQSDGSTSHNDVRFIILMNRHDGEFNVLDDPRSIVLDSEGVSLRNFDLEKEEDLERWDQENGNWQEGNVGGFIARGFYHTMQRQKFIKEQEKSKSGLSLVSSSNGESHFKLIGIATAPYQFDVNIHYNPDNGSSEVSSGVTFKVIKLSCEYDPSAKDGDTGGLNKRKVLQLASFSEIINQKLTYPHSSMVGVNIDSKNFSSSPNRTYHVKLKKILIPSNYNPESKTYDGPWDGLFKGQTDLAQSVNEISESNKVWSDNPAWVFFDMLHNPRYGIGKYGLEEYSIDRWQLYKVGKYCDQLIETDFPVETQTLEPRGCKIYISSRGRRSNFEINVDDSAVSASVFTKEFGSGTSFAGKKIAIFVHQHNFGQGQGLDSDQQDTLTRKSINREGEIKVYERVIVYSNTSTRKITVKGPDLRDDSANFESNGIKLIAACATQINYPIVEPRFTANLYLTERSEALEIINSMASIFRGMIAYSSGKVGATYDRDKIPVQLFNNSNILGGDFSYAGVHKNKKATACLVRFNNKDKSFKPDIVYEEDESSMISLGYIENETMGFGITSESQARRLARWILMTSQLETETVKFNAGQEASYLTAGSIIEISDEVRTSSDKSGRILDIQLYRNKILVSQSSGSFTQQYQEYFEPYILIDKSHLSSPGIDKVEIVISLARTNESLEMIEQRARVEESEEDQDQEIESLRTSQILRFEGRVSSDPTVRNFGPQGQKTIIEDLKIKIQMEVSVSDNLIKIYNHGFSDGQKVSFTSDGKLPGGINKTNDGSSNYFVTNSTRHTFQISKTSGGLVVNIFNIGLDMFGNVGGRHYLISSDADMLKDFLDQINLGAAYSIRGLVSVTGELEQISSSTAESIGSNSTEPLSAANSYKSDFLGRYYNSGADWIFIYQSGLWLYIGRLKNRVIGSQDGFWMYIGGSESEVESTGIGWVWTNDNYKNTFWYINTIKKWVYVIYDNSSRDNIVGFYVYDSGTNLSVGDYYILGKDQRLFISGKDSNGFFLMFSETGDVANYMEASSNNPPSSSDLENPRAVKSDISAMYSVDENQSVQGESAVRVELSGGHGINLDLTQIIDISAVASANQQFDNLINSEWYFSKVDTNVIELESSASLIGLMIGITEYGFVNIELPPESKVFRKLESQLFRTISVKELSENKYEVTALEYNPSKFLAVEQKGPPRSPALPIPPQADMSLPDAPDGLLLFDLTV